jgi:hypothetical protein
MASFYTFQSPPPVLKATVASDIDSPSVRTGAVPVALGNLTNKASLAVPATVKRKKVGVLSQ